MDAATRPELRPRDIGPQSLPDPAAGRIGRGDERLAERESPRRGLSFEAASAAAVSDEVADLVERDEVAHLATNRCHADLEPPLGPAVTVRYPDDHGTALTRDTGDAVSCAEIVDVQVERPGSHRASVVRAVAVTTMAR